MAQTFSPRIWSNDTGLRLNETNLNNLENGIDVIDGRVANVELGVAVPMTLAYAPSMTLNVSGGARFRISATGDLTVADIVGGTNGQEISLEITASGGSRTITVGGVADVVTAGGRWVGKFVYDQPADTWTQIAGGGGGSSSGGGSVGAGSITDANVATNAAISLDKTADSGTRSALSASDRSKLNSVASGATANATDAQLRDRATHTGTQPVSSLATTGTASSSTFLNGAGVWAAPSEVAHNLQTGTAYTLVLADAGKVVETNNSSANTVTIPPNSAVAFPVGAYLSVRQYGAGQTTLAAGAGVTLRSRGGALKLAGQYAETALTQRAVNEWVVSGEVTP